MDGASPHHCTPHCRPRFHLPLSSCSRRSLPGSLKSAACPCDPGGRSPARPARLVPVMRFWYSNGRAAQFLPDSLRQRSDTLPRGGHSRPGGIEGAMKHYYYLYPEADGPFLNPFTSEDPELLLFSQVAVRCIRGRFDQDSDDSGLRGGKKQIEEWARESDAQLFYITSEACVCAFAILANRVLRAESASELFVDVALCEAAKRVVGLAFYLQYQDMGHRMGYSDKRAIEIVLVDMADRAKDLWRGWLLDGESTILMKHDPDWRIPNLATFLSEELWNLIHARQPAPA